MAEKKKVRTEIQFHAENQKDQELLAFIDENGTTRAGFIKQVLFHYMNTFKSQEDGENISLPKMEPSAPKSKTQNTKSKKKLPNLNGSSFSSNDLD